MDLKNKSILITGAARRLGRETAVHLVKAGARLTIHFNESVKEAEALRKEIGCEIVQADFNKISPNELCKKLESAVKDVDVLINNASSFIHSAWHEITEEIWDQELTVNLKVPFFLTKHFGSLMKSKGSGKILNIADIAAEHPYLMYFPYSIAKAGIVTMTRGFARALAPAVQVNAIAPGTVLRPDNMPADQFQKLIEKIPAHRPANVEEFLRTVDFLLRDVDYITGQTIVLDGGRSLNW
jgi:NAD(P)-dependent dehydrogenase (short-subunit alcohol dehydrogenase family)